MDKEQEKQFKNDCAALLELVREVSVRNGKAIGIQINSLGRGIVRDESNLICEIGYTEPTNKAVICK
jgi:hypothetical protein